MMKPSVFSSIVVLEIEIGVICVGFLEITVFFFLPCYSSFTSTMKQ